MKNKSIIAAFAGLCLVNFTFAEGRERLSKEDREAFRERAQEHIQSVLEESDFDGDGYFSEYEIITVIESVQAHREQVRERIMERAEASGRELPDLPGRDGRERPSPEEIASLILERIDEDGDSLVSREELETVLERMSKPGRRGERSKES